MSAVAAEIADGLRFIAPASEGERIKARIFKAARACGFSESRTYDLWYSRARRVDAHELEAVRLAKIKKSEARANELTSIAVEFEALSERIARLASRSAGTDAVAARSLADRLRRVAAGA